MANTVADQESGGTRALDHYIIQVHDLKEAGESYERLGFRVLPRMVHEEIGCANRVAQFKNTYLELLGDLDLAPREMMKEYLPRFECGEGLSHVSLRSFDLEADHQTASNLGLNPDTPRNARRKVVMPDASVEETNSHCFYMWRQDRLYLSLFLSIHYKPEIIWIPEYQQHPNTAIDTIEVTYVSDDPKKDQEYFSKLYRTGAAVDSAGLVEFRGNRGDIAAVCSREKIHERYAPLGIDVCDCQPGYPVGLSFSVGSLEQCRSVLEKGGVRYERAEGRLLVSPDEAHGVVIEFVQLDSA